MRSTSFSACSTRSRLATGVVLSASMLALLALASPSQADDAGAAAETAPEKAERFAAAGRVLPTGSSIGQSILRLLVVLLPALALRCATPAL